MRPRASPCFCCNCAEPGVERPHCSGLYNQRAARARLALSVSVQPGPPGVDVKVGPGNPAAVAIDMNAAQGSTLEDVAVYAAADAAAASLAGTAVPRV